LAVVASCENLTHEPAEHSWFDWRQLEWMQLVSGRQWRAEELAVPITSPAADDSLEAFLGQLAPELIACRTPIAPGTRERWQRTFVALD
jgi:hypothetical protein